MIIMALNYEASQPRSILTRLNGPKIFLYEQLRRYAAFLDARELAAVSKVSGYY
jgi:hypothetical protein